MADISKQVSEGQKKWSQGVDLTSIADVNNYIKFKTLEYEYYELMNDDLWEQYQEDFAGFTEAIFKACNPAIIRNLRTLLRHQGVWVKTDKRAIIAQSLYNTLCEEDQTEWTIKEILDQVRATSKLFAFAKLNRIAGLVPDILNQICPINPSDFGINLTGQSTPVKLDELEAHVKPDEMEAPLPTLEDPQEPTEPAEPAVKHGQGHPRKHPVATENHLTSAGTSVRQSPPADISVLVQEAYFTDL